MITDWSNRPGRLSLTSLVNLHSKSAGVRIRVRWRRRRLQPLLGPEPGEHSVREAPAAPVGVQPSPQVLHTLIIELVELIE